MHIINENDVLSLFVSHPSRCTQQINGTVASHKPNQIVVDVKSPPRLDAITVAMDDYSGKLTAYRGRTWIRMGTVTSIAAVKSSPTQTSKLRI